MSEMEKGIEALHILAGIDFRDYDWGMYNCNRCVPHPSGA